MTDLAFELLQQRLASHEGRGLWVVDENITASEILRVLPVDGLQALTNRYDTSEQLKARGFDVLLSDFDFSLFPTCSVDAIYYRVSKEKPVVHHVINAAAQVLRDEGVLVLSGYKNEGTKTYIDKAVKYLGELADKTLGGKTSMIASVVCSDVSSAPLDDKDYRQLRVINPADTVSFVSKPGVFGWDKIDKGSAFLIEHLDGFLQGIHGPLNSVADLGCGYGYISVMASQLMEATFFASDNNVAAVAACRENFKRLAVNGSVTLDHCAAGLQQPVDLVLCNPPFHQGFDVEGDLTTLFLERCAGLLNSGGVALFVVNAFIPLEKKALPFFSSVETVANNRSFKLITLRV